MNLTAGTVLQNGKYVLDSPLGQSALGITFKATQPHLHQTVVLETLRSQPQTDLAHLKQRFTNEARRFAQCQHPGLVRVLDMFEDAGLPFVVMDSVTGQTLADQVRSRALLSESEAVQYIRQAGSALSVMHRQGMLHRDVKPEHLVRPKGAAFVVLVGFGIAHYAVLGVPDTEPLQSSYAAIELHQRQVNLSPATDIYALAATLYFLVTGQAPIAATQRNQSPLTSPRQLQPHLSAALDHAILSGMALNAQERPQTIAAWFALLPDSNPLPSVQGFTNVAVPLQPALEQPSAAAISNGSSRPTSLPPSTTAQATHAVAPQASKPMAGVAPAPKSRLPKALLMTAAIASAAGLGLGLALRFSAAHGIGPTFFQTRQDFPPVQNWPLQATPAALSTAPPLPEPPPVSSQPAPVRQPRVKAPPGPSPVPQTPEPSPSATIEATPTPAVSPNEPATNQPSPLPDAALPTNPSPLPLPTVQ